VCVVDEQVSAEWIGDPPLHPSQEGIHSKKLSKNEEDQLFKHFEQGNYRGKVLVCVVDEQVSEEWIGDPPLLPLIVGQDVREDPPPLPLIAGQAPDYFRDRPPRRTHPSNYVPSLREPPRRRPF
jgi:hypothetical protein